MIIFYLCLAVFIGILIPIQSGINSKLGKVLDNPFLGAMISFTVGVVALTLINLAYRTHFSNLSYVWTSQPWYIWVGGLLGATFVTSTIVITPILGTSLTVGLVLLGQLTISLFIDHYGWFDLPIKPINFYKVLGIILIGLGIWFVRKF